MNKPASRFPVALRYLSLVPLAVLGILSILGTGGGSSGGGGGGGGSVACASIIDIDPNSALAGDLLVGDCTIEDLFPGSGDFSFVDQYRTTLSTNGTLTIRMDSTEIDSFLWLFSSLQQPAIAVDDDSGGNLNALIDLHLDAGSYVILANSLFPGEIGAYTLTTTFTPD